MHEEKNSRSQQAATISITTYLLSTTTSEFDNRIEKNRKQHQQSTSTDLQLQLQLQYVTIENQQIPIFVVNQNLSRCHDRCQECCQKLALLIHIYHH